MGKQGRPFGIPMQITTDMEGPSVKLSLFANLGSCGAGGPAPRVFLHSRQNLQFPSRESGRRENPNLSFLSSRESALSGSADFGGVIYTPLIGRSGFLRAPPTYTLAPHARLPGGLKIIASSWRTELNRILTHFPGVAMI